MKVFLQQCSPSALSVMFVIPVAWMVKSIFVDGNNSLPQIRKSKLPLCAASVMNSLDLVQ